MKTHSTKNGLTFPRRLRMLLAGTALAVCLSLPQPARAQCEPSEVAVAGMILVTQQDNQYFNQLLTQEASFIWNILSTSFDNMSQAYFTFDQNVESALNSYATQVNTKGSTGALYPMTMELHHSQVEQTYRLGQQQDAQLMVEEEARKENLINDALKRYAPSDLACQMDTTGPGLNRAYQISRALNHTLALDDEPRREGAIGKWPALDDSGNWTSQPTSSFNGKATEVNATWATYVSKYCDNTLGDVGCTTPGTDAGRNRDIGAMLWGSQQTIDPTNQENIRVMQDSLRVIIDPLAPDIIKQTIVPMPGNVLANAAPGRKAILDRHAEMAYVNTIYNVLGGMLSERIGGSKVDVSLLRTAAGLPTAATQPGTLPNVGASYREVSEAMTRDRFNDPQYLVKMLGDPAQVARERNVLSGLRLQTMNDTYRRQEEMLFMEASEYGRDLNARVPRPKVNKTPFSTGAGQ